MSTLSQANEKDTSFQTHYDWTAVPLGNFQIQQSLPGQPLTATAGSCDGIGDTLALPLQILNTSQFGTLLWYLTAITGCAELVVNV